MSYDAKYSEMFRRLELGNVEIEKAKDSEDVIRKFRYFTGRGTTTKQDNVLRQYAESKGLPVKYRVRYHTKKGIVYHERKRDIKGRFTKK